MSKRFEAYRFKDGETHLDASTFNFIFGELDARVADLEAAKISWDAAIANVVAFGLTRLDQAISPLQAQGAATIAAVQTEAATTRVALQAAIDSVNTIKAQAQAALDQAQASVGTFATKTGLWATRAADAGTTATPAFNAGVLTSFTDVLDGQNRVMTPSYDGNGRITQTTTTWNGHTRTEVYTFDGNSALQSIAITEA